MRFNTGMELSSVIIRYFYTLLVSVVLLFTSPLGAQDVNSTESDFFDETPLILTASRMSKPLDESPASVSVIDREMIESSGARELADIFRMVPGFLVGNFSGNTPVVTYQGLGNVFSRQLQVLVDGRSVFIPSFGGVPWVNLPLLLEDIERVEVIRGPNAVTYGANAFLATINIITRHAAEDFGARYSLTTSGGNNPEVADAYFRLGYHVDDLDWRLSVGTLNDDGFESLNDSRETNKLNFRLDYMASNNQFWTIQLGTSNSISGKGVDDNPTNIERDEDATNSYININWEQVRSDSTTSVRLTHTVQEVVDNFTPEPLTLGPVPGVMTFIDFDRDSNRTDLEFIQTEEMNDSLRFVYGASVRKDRVKSLFLMNSKRFEEIDTSRLFTSFEWHFGDNWILDFGTTLEDSTLTEAAYSPRFSILRRINDNNVLRFVASRAKRNPILFEHSGLTVFSANAFVPGLGDIDLDVQTFEGNSDIEPEDLVSYEIGLHSQYANRSITSDIKVFTYKITDLIADSSFEAIHPLLGTIPISTTKNDEDDVRVEGLEIAFNISPIDNFDIKSGFSFISVDSDDTDDAPVTYPDSSAFITTSYQWLASHSISASMYYIDEMEWLDTQDVTPSINKLDLRYAYTLDKTSETRIELIGQNLLEEYDDYLDGNLIERTYLLRVSGGF